MVSELRRGSESNGGGVSTHMHVVCMAMPRGEEMGMKGGYAW